MLALALGTGTGLLKNAVGAGTPPPAPPAATFYAPLVNGTLAPATGTGTYTFTRASTATLLDFEGVCRDCAVNEARFVTARRVENLLRRANAKSSDFQDGVWSPDSGAFTSATTFVNGAGTGTQVGPVVTGIFSGNPNGRTFRIRFEAKYQTAVNATIGVRLIDTAFTGVPLAFNITSGATMTTSYQKFSFLITCSGITTPWTGVDMNFRYNGTLDTTRVFDIRNISIEDVTGQANTNPADYVSYGMGDDHGCGADGVKYFTTANANTVSGAFVVTEAAGSALGTLGYLPGQEKINRLFPSEDATVTWTLTNLACAKPGTFLAGRRVLNTCKATTTSSVEHTIGSTQLTTLIDNQDIAVGVFAKAGTLNHVFLRVKKGADSAVQFFNVSAGTIGTASDSGGAITVDADTPQMHPIAGGGYFVHVIINGASAGAHTLEFGVASADNATAFAAANTTDVLMNMTAFQGQRDHEIGEYIPTTSAAFTVSGDVLSYDPANVADAALAITSECDPTLACASNCSVISIEDGGNSGYFLGARSTNQLEASAFDTTATRVWRARSPAVGEPTHHKAGAVFGRAINSRIAALNGSVVSEDPVDLVDSTTWTPTSFMVGANLGDTGQPDFVVSHIKVYPGMTASQLMLETADLA